MLPCPRTCVLLLQECIDVTFDLLSCGDIESNPGPDEGGTDTPLTMKEMAKSILVTQNVIINDLGVIKTSQQQFESKFDSLAKRVEQIEVIVQDTNEVKDQVVGLQQSVTSMQEDLFECQRKLRSLEDYSRRNNLVVFGIPEDNNETADTLKSKVLDGVFEETLGIRVNTVERLHGVGRKTNRN
uniref:Putative transposase domain-containing protein n=1 Tax=Ixodes ricinus TaxID=34613 RepID=A0A6B0V1R4_IXORI